MLNIELFREKETRETIRKSEADRFKDPGIVDKIYELDLEWIRTNHLYEIKSKEINQINKKYGEKIRENKSDSEMLKKIQKDLEDLVLNPKNEQAEFRAKSMGLKNEVNKLLNTVGNILDTDVPVCKDESGNIVCRDYASTKTQDSKAFRPYSEIMGKYTNSVVSTEVVGHRGYYLEGKMALLGRALKNYAIDFLCERGHIFIQTPVMMKKDVMAKTSQLSDFDEQLYRVENDLYLVATSEQPMTALFMNKHLEPSKLPMSYAGESLCFRKEAGAYGKDNAGIFRVHQFEKIEQFVICAPEDSAEHHERIINIAEEFYRTLEISHRVVLIASGEMNDAASKKYDLEAWFPSSRKYRELVSASNCKDYQSRNLNVCYRQPASGKKQEYVHMLNSTLCAIQRTLCCIVENYQDGSVVRVPKVLVKYTGFTEVEI